MLATICPSYPTIRDGEGQLNTADAAYIYQAADELDASRMKSLNYDTLMSVFAAMEDRIGEKPNTQHIEALLDKVKECIQLRDANATLTRRVEELEGALKKARDVLYEDALNRLRYMQMSEGGRLMAAKNTVSEYDAALAAKGAA
jgi:hypothetical protein